MGGLVADLKHALRIYARTPVASAVAVLALAVALAFVSAFLSLWNDLALQPHPGFEDSGRLVTVAMSNGDTMAGTSIALMEDISENVSLIEGVATDQIFPCTVRVGTERVEVRAEVVVRRYFPLLRPRMLFGRGLEPSDHDPGAEPVVVIGYDFWQRHFGGRRDVIGETLGLEQTTMMRMMAGVDPRQAQPESNVYQHRIVGVLAPGMKGTFQQATEIFFPFEPVMTLQWQNPEGEAPSIAELYEQAAGLTGVGRLAPGATVEALQAELDRRYTAEAYPLVATRASAGMKLSVIGGVHLDLKARREGLEQVNLFLAGTIVLALVAGANVSLFLLSRAPGRRRELAIRTALGATTRRLARQLFSEAGLIVAVASLIGLLASLWLVVVLRDLPLFTTVRWRDVSPIDWRVLGILAALALLLVTMVSIAPVFGLGRAGIGAASRRISARAGLGQTLAGSLQLAAAAVLGGVAIGFGSQLLIYTRADPGFTLDDVLVVQPQTQSINALLGLIAVGAPLPQTMQVEQARKSEILASMPGIDAVSFSSSMPSLGSAFPRGQPRAVFAPGSDFGDPEEQVELTAMQVSENFPDFLGLRLISGRSFFESPSADVIVTETAARLLWGRTDVVGERFSLFQGAGTGEVIGVVGELSFAHPRDGRPALVFQVSSTESGLMLLRTRHSPAALRSLLEERIEAGELEFQVGRIERLRDLWLAIFAQDRLRLALTLSGAGLTLLLAAFGVYGTQRYLVAAGRREYAIRAALGAGPRSLGKLVVTRGLLLCVPGAAFGLVLAALTVVLIRERYFAGSSSPLVITAITALAMLALVMAATFGPALQASRTAPAPLLRED